MRILLDRYPREAWDAHPGFKEKTRNWLGAYQMFRQVAKRVRLDAESLLNKERGPDDNAGRLSYYGGNLIGNLNGHHGWEDHSYFPELSAADPRFEAGLEVLETDHTDPDRLLDDFTRQANHVIKLGHLDEAQAREEAANVHGMSKVIEAFLKRHLGNEEELAVPIILNHRLSG